MQQHFTIFPGFKEWLIKVGQFYKPIIKIKLWNYLLRSLFHQLEIATWLYLFF